ncbi:MAG TPA: sigma 54-interacting transcriptional regulator [Tepidisphaeraceae bacterium]|nr:sigma 54-interacting transcriptional regulator [Tepidisphaeraceae bacterium]
MRQPTPDDYPIGKTSTISDRAMAKDANIAGSPLLRQQYDVLLGLPDSLVSCHNIDQLVDGLSKCLGDLTRSNFFAIHLPVENETAVVMHVAEVDGPLRLQNNPGIPIGQSPAGMVLRTQQMLNVLDYESETRWPLTREMCTQLEIKSFTMFPLTTARRRVGVMTFASRQSKLFSEDEVAFLAQVARQVAIALENVLNIAHLSQARKDLCTERDRVRLLLDLNNTCITHTDIREMFQAFSRRLRSEMNHRYAALLIHDPRKNDLVMTASETDNTPSVLPMGWRFSDKSTPSSLAFSTRLPQVADIDGVAKYEPHVIKVLEAMGVRSLCAIPLLLGDRALGVFATGSIDLNAFDSDTVQMLTQVGDQLSIAVANALAFEQIEELRKRVAEEKLYLEDEVKTQYNFEEIVGKSAALSHVLKQVDVVAGTDATVIITGETGTGKELIARAIHNRSPRRDRTFIKINCAAIPAPLLESELFGHEKGAFTGALSKRIGRFELADGGTLFLDEIGDTPLEIQTKLLRVLQEREFERLGSSETIRTDVRLLAATNCDLDSMVASRSFRADLFYRLNVFPIRMPALRERLEDLPLLVQFFADRSARRMKKRIGTVSPDSLQAMAEYHWPGNLRELENFVEHAVILSTGPTLELPLAELRWAPQPSVSPTRSVLKDAERDHILGALRDTRWIIGGADGAAARLGLKRTTLQSRMKKLGIYRPV